MKRAIAMLLAIFMIVGQLPVSALAAPSPGSAEQTGTAAIIDSPVSQFGKSDGEFSEAFADLFGDSYMKTNTKISAFESYSEHTLASDGAAGMSLTAESEAQVLNAGPSFLMVGGVDALANPSGDGWRYDADTGVLTFSQEYATSGNASNVVYMMADSDGYGIYAEGAPLTIEIVAGTELHIDAYICAIFSEYTLRIMGEGSLRLTTEERFSCGIACGDLVEISWLYNVYIEGASGIEAGSVSIGYCYDVQIVVRLCGLFVDGRNGTPSVYIDSSWVTINVYGTLEEAVEVDAFIPPIAIYCVGDVTLAYNNYFEINAYWGILAEGSMNLHYTNLVMDYAYMGLAAPLSIKTTGSCLEMKQCMSVAEVLSVELGLPYAGIVLMDGMGTLTMSDSSLYLQDAFFGLYVPTIYFNDVEADIKNNVYGVFSSYVVMENCPSISIDAGTQMFEEASAHGFGSDIMPGGIITIYNDIVIENCPDVRVTGAIAGIAALDSAVNVIDSTLSASANLYGIAGAYATIYNSNVYAEAFWNQDEAMNMAGCRSYAIVGISALSLVNCAAENGVYVDYSDEYMFTLIGSEPGVPVTSISIVPVNDDEEEFSGQCGDDAYWSLSNNGILTVTGSGDMYHFEADAQPWVDLRDRITAVSIGDSVTSVGMNAFYGCENLTSVTIGDSVTRIYDTAFMSCSALTDLKLGAGLTRIDDAAFAYTSMVDVEIPEGVVHIGPMAFTGYRLETIYVPASAKEIDPAFADYTASLRRIDVHEGNPVYCSDANGIMYNKDQTKIILVPACLEGSYTVPASVTGIREYAFYSCSNLTVYFTGDMPVVEEYAFDCAKITIYYSACNDTWTEDKLADIDGSINWVGQHSYILDTEVPPTCTENGSIIYTCECGAAYTETIEALGHNYTSVVTDPTCTKTGYTTHTCSDCGDTYTSNYISSLGHNYTSVVTAPTCTEMGYTTYTCTVCGDSDKTDLVDPISHSYETVVTEPTCTEMGYTTYTCTDCGNSYADDFVGSTGHNHEAVVTDPTCIHQGYTTYTCSICGDSYVSDYTDPVSEHSYEDGICIHCGVKASYYIKLDAVTNVTIEEAGQIVTFCFTPTETGRYTFYSMGDLDTYGTLDGDSDDVIYGTPSNDDANGTKNFSITFALEAGIPYTLTAKLADSTMTGTFDVCITKAPIPVIELNTDTVVPIVYRDDTVYFSFTPTETGDYTFYSDVFYKTVGNIYDTNMNLLAEGGDSRGTRNFSVTYTMEAGTTYILSAEYWANTIVGDIVIKIIPAEEPGNITWDLSEDGVLTISGTGNMDNYPDASAQPWYSQQSLIKSVVIEEGVTSVGDYAFEDCESLTSVTIADSVIFIGGGAFSYCKNLTNVVIPEGVTIIGYNAFTYCTSLTDLKIPETVTYIGYAACYGCSSLTSLVIPASMAFMDDNTFFNCTGLTEIWFMGSAPKGCYRTFNNVTATVYYPAGDASWTDKVKQNFSGTLTWVTYGECNHNYEAVVTDPTCTNPGYTTYTCGNCGDTYVADETEALGHNYTSVVTAPTCTEQGYTTNTCHCGVWYYSDYTDALGHDYEAVVTAPTCTEAGYTTYTCGICGDTYTESIEALGHDYTSVVTAPTCTEAGYTTHTCGHCGDSYVSDEVAAQGHSYESVTVEPTCTEAGSITYTCACGDTYAETIDALGHDYASVVTAPTCNEAGYTTHTCGNCGDTYVSDEVAALGHNYESVTVEPTCTEAGSITYTCGICGDTYTESIEALGHDYTSKVTAPTCTEAGYTTYTCGHCGDSYVSDEVAALGHSYENGSCTACGAEDPDYVKPIQITSKPNDYTGVVGDMATFTVEAVGEGLTYQWEYSMDNGETWQKSSCVSDIYSLEIKDYRLNYLYRCVITDAEGNSVTSDVVKLIPADMALEILSQPVSYAGAVNDEVTFTVEATGNGVTYEWFYSADGGATWTKSYATGYMTNTLEVVLHSYRDGYLYKCVVSDVLGNSVESDTASMTVKAEEIVIIKQPADTSCLLDETAVFTVEATGSNLTYRWQYSSDGGETWQDTWLDGYNTASLTVAMKTNRNGNLYRCVITSGQQTAVTEAASLVQMKRSLEITEQPVDAAVPTGQKASFTVAAQGENVRYQWYVSADNGETWTKTYLDGSTTATLSFVVTAARAAKIYKCVVTDASGDAVASNAVKVVPVELKILTQPESATCAMGDTAAFTVEAQGESLKYQWYYSADGGETWTKTYLDGSTTATLSFAVTAARAAKVYKCVITDASGTTVESNVVTVLPVALEILTQPVSITCAVGETAVFTVEAQGDGLKYQWYVSYDQGATWEKTYLDGSMTNELSFVVNQSRATRVFKCQITDVSGNSVVTDVVGVTIG